MIEEKTYEQLAEALSKERESNRILQEVNSTPNGEKAQCSV